MQKIGYFVYNRAKKLRSEAQVEDVAGLVVKVSKKKLTRATKEHKPGSIISEATGGLVVVGYTTPAMLKRGLEAEASVCGAVLMADDTFRVLSNKYAVVLVGVPDLHQHLHILGAFVVSDVSKAAYIRVFEAIADAVGLVSSGAGTRWVGVTAGLSDGAAAIRAAARAVFGEQLPWHECKFHIIQG